MRAGDWYAMLFWCAVLAAVIALAVKRAVRNIAILLSYDGSA